MLGPVHPRPHSFIEPATGHIITCNLKTSLRKSLDLEIFLSHSFGFNLSSFKWKLYFGIMASNQITYMSKYMLLIILFSAVPADITSDLFRNQLHFGYGIN